MRKLRVYGWTGYRKECPPAQNGSHQTREIVAARSMKEAARIAGYRDPRSLDMCDTGNKKEIEVATSNPGTIYWKPLDSWNGAWTRAG